MYHKHFHRVGSKTDSRMQTGKVHVGDFKWGLCGPFDRIRCALLLYHAAFAWETQAAIRGQAQATEYCNSISELWNRHTCSVSQVCTSAPPGRSQGRQLRPFHYR